MRSNDKYLILVYEFERLVYIVDSGEPSFSDCAFVLERPLLLFLPSI